MFARQNDRFKAHAIPLLTNNAPVLTLKKLSQWRLVRPCTKQASMRSALLSGLRPQDCPTAHLAYGPSHLRWVELRFVLIKGLRSVSEPYCGASRSVMLHATFRRASASPTVCLLPIKIASSHFFCLYIF